MSSRTYTSRRNAIVQSLVTLLKTIDGGTAFRSNLNNNVVGRLMFWDEVEDFPSAHLSAGAETRQYQGAGYKDRFLVVTIRVYVNTENANDALEALMEDIETVIEDNNRLAYTDRDGNEQFTQLISIVSIDTDEGVLEPLGIGELICEVRY